MNKMKNSISITGVVLKVLLIIISILFLWPFYWMISSSFKEMTVAFRIPPEFFPMSPTVQNYVKLFDNGASKWFLNSLYISILTTAANLIIDAMAAYAIAKINFRAGKYIMAAFIASMSLPSAALLIPQFKITLQLRMMNTYQGMIIPVLAAPFGIFLLKQFMQTLPSEVIESARIDGCSEFGIFARIILPMSKAALGALAIFTFVGSWNNYIWQLLIIKSTKMMTLPLGIASLVNIEIRDWGMNMAGATIATLPILTIFFSFQKYFTKGITLGAVKG